MRVLLACGHRSMRFKRKIHKWAAARGTSYCPTCKQMRQVMRGPQP